MKFKPRVLITSLAALVAIASSFANAAGRDDGQNLAKMAKEARARAQDFTKTMDEREREDNTREHEGQKWRAEQDKLDEKRENLRSAYVRERNAKPPTDLVRLRGEAEDEKRIAREEAVHNRIRKIYVEQKRERDAVVERQGQIDEKREYGL